MGAVLCRTTTSDVGKSRATLVQKSLVESIATCDTTSTPFTKEESHKHILPKRKSFKNKKSKECKYPEVSAFPFAKPKLVQPRNRPQKPVVPGSHNKFSYNCFGTNIRRIPTTTVTEASPTSVQIDGDFTEQYRALANCMEHGPTSRMAFAQRHADMAQTRQMLWVCNTAAHLRLEYLKEKYKK